jgi:mannose-1-phosphate guanylyltransferase
MKKDSARVNLAIIIMAGGMGTRFWPASRERIPKQFLPICSSRPMLEECFIRIAPLVDPDKIFVVVNVQHGDLTRDLLSGRGIQIIEEPYGRNTLPCIGLGCVHIMKHLGDLPVIALPADHFISDEESFRRSLQQGVSLLKDGEIGTLGIAPTYPETGYGYIETGPSLGKFGANRVTRFVEKPDVERARRFLASGKHLWNAGIFFFRPSTMLREIGLHLPKMGQGLDRISESFETDHYLQTLEETYRKLESISVDYGIMEKTEESVYVIKGNFGWSDVGNWAALRKLREAEKDGDGNIAPEKALVLHTKNSFIHSQSDRFIAVLGLDNLLVVDTEDVLLVAKIDHSQELRQFPEKLRRKKEWSRYV